MRYSPIEIALGVLKTTALLIVLEVITSALLPAMGIIDFKPAFNVLVVLYLAFKLDLPILPFLILYFQYIHSLFSIEGWASGTFTGILVSISVRYIKDMLNFTSAMSTIIVVQIFQIIWFIFVAGILSMKLGDFSHFFGIFWKYLPESFVLSLMSHYFFKLLDAFWVMNKKTSGATL